MFIIDDLPQRRRYDLENHQCKSGRTETIVIELILKKYKWLIHSIYKQPILKDIHIQSIIERIECNCHWEGVNYVTCGDLNVNMLKSNYITDIMDAHGCRNIVAKATCFMSKVVTLKDVVIKNVSEVYNTLHVLIVT